MLPRITRSPSILQVASNVRDGLAKATYQRVFAWMVMRINANLAIQVASSLAPSVAHT